MAKLDWEKANRRDRDRQARRDEVADPVLRSRVIKLEYPGTCGVCGQRMRPGARARWYSDGWVEHLDCGAELLEEFDPAG